MFKKYSLPVFILALVFLGLADNVNASALDVFNTCPSSNAPLNTVVCSSGQKWIGSTSGGSCKTLAQVESTINSCTTVKNDVYNCASNSCVCASGFPIDCRSSVPAGNKCIATAIPSPTAACDILHKVSNSCGICGDCQSDYEDCSGTCTLIVSGKTCGTCSPGSISYPSYLNTLKKILNPGAVAGTGCITFENLLKEAIETIIGIFNLPVNCDNDNTHESANNEFCDDGSGGTDLTPTNDCRNCVWYGAAPNCGDSTLQNGEQCDDGNTVAGDGCDDRCYNEVKPTSGLGQFAGLSSASFSVTASYETVNNYCKTGNVVAPTNATTGTATSIVGAHVCDASEMTNSYNNGNVAIGYMATNTAMDDVGLINNGPPGYTSWSNDCAGWTNISGTVGSNTVYGAVWFFVNKMGSLNKCSDIKANGVKFACCK